MTARDELMKHLRSYFVEMSGDAKRSREQAEGLVNAYGHELSEKLRTAGPHVTQAVFARSSIQDGVTLIEAAFAEAADLIDPNVSKLDARELEVMMQQLTEKYLWPKLRAAGIDDPERHTLRWEKPA